MSKQIDKRSSSYWRPVSDLTVTYLCFPGTAKKPHRAPDYEDWRENCQRLLDEIGGLKEGVELFRWGNTLPVQEELEEGLSAESEQSE